MAPTSSVGGNWEEETPPKETHVAARSTHVNDQPFDPPTWIQTYIDFFTTTMKQQSTLENKDKPRWLQWYCNYETFDDDDQIQQHRHSGGLADRLKGMLEALVLAMIDHRLVFLEEWEGTALTGPHPLTDYLEPNALAWNNTPPELSISKKGKIKGLANFRSFIDFLKGTKSLPQRIVKQAPCSFGIGKATGVRFTGNALSDEGLLTDCGPLAGADASTLYADLFWTLFRFSDIVHEQADLLRGPQIIPTNRNFYIAAHVRTGNFTNAGGQKPYNDVLRQHGEQSWDQFAFCIQQVARAIQERCGGDAPVTYLASDNMDAKRYIAQKAQQVPIHAPDVETMHIGLHKAPAAEADEQQQLDDNSRTAAYRSVMAEFKILMDSTCLIFSDSGYSKMAQVVVTATSAMCDCLRSL